MDQLFKFINNLNSAQRAVIIGGFSILFIILIGFLVYSNLKAQDKKLNYIIASNLTKNQVMLASNELESSGIAFSVIGSGNNLTLKTSKEFINIAKIKLVTSEASTSKHVGWEIFEKSSLGTTNFENKVKYLRALEGELSRSLESLVGILNASVKIAVPKETIFTERQSTTTASAVLTLKPGLFLTQKQIDGIKNFIASAVSNLRTENIKLIDQDGAMLQHSVSDMENQQSMTQNKYKNKMEKEFESKIVALLEPFVGLGRVVARVSMELNFSKERIQEEIYDPEGTIRSEQSTESNSSAIGTGSNSGGVPGVENNIQDPASTGGDGSSQSSNSNAKNIINYEISKKIIDHEEQNYATVNRISAAVTFDSSVLKDVANRDEFLASITSIVQDTIGYSEDRGDKITVKDFKFLGFKSLPTAGSSGASTGEGAETVDESGSSVDTFTMVRTILKDFSEYFQYIFAGILLLIFYKKFIVNHEIVVMGSDGKKKNGKGQSVDDQGNILDALEDSYDHEFDVNSAKGRLKAKVKSQIMNNIDGLDEENAAKYEILIEELDREIQDSPEEMARMIEMLLSEGSKNFR